MGIAVNPVLEDLLPKQVISSSPLIFNNGEASYRRHP